MRDHTTTMASLETVVFPQDPFGYYTGRDLYGLLGDAGIGGSSVGFLDDLEVDCKLGPLDIGNFLESQIVDLPHSGELSLSPYPDYPCSSTPRVEADQATREAVAVVIGERPKRRRGKSRKNKEDTENQRMIHIAVERNRRKQMNEYLSALRSLMPESYVQRGDQASIIGGAINFVKELEQQVHLLGARKQPDPLHQGSPSATLPLPFSDCFSLPQYSSENDPPSTLGEAAASMPTQPNEVADIEVTMVESHASMKIRSKRRPKQLLRLVSGLQALRLTVLHLNVSTVGQVVLYSLSLKVEDDCKLTSVDDIASAVYQILVKIQEEVCEN